jgi:FixJ family two-component response regulator
LAHVPSGLIPDPTSAALVHVMPMTVQAMKAGLSSSKPFSDEGLLNAIRDALERSRVALDHEAEMWAVWDCYASLTSRER